MLVLRATRLSGLTAVLDWLGECGDAGDVAFDNQGLHGLGAFVGVDDLDVAHIAE